MIIEMPYGKVEIHNIEEAIHFIKYRCNNCCHSSEMWSCSGHQASICEAKEQELIEAIKKAKKNGLTEVK
jgi:hypothetical protein